MFESFMKTHGSVVRSERHTAHASFVVRACSQRDNRCTDYLVVIRMAMWYDQHDILYLYLFVRACSQRDNHCTDYIVVRRVATW